MMEPSRRRTAIEVPWRTLFKLFAAAALVWLWLQLAEVVLVLIVAALLAVTLNPVVAWLERRGLSRLAATSLLGFGMLALVGGFLWASWASLEDQVTYVSKHFRELEQNGAQKLPAWLRNTLGARTPGEIESKLAGYAVRLAQSAASAVVVTVLGFILTLYLLIEGRPTVDWLMAFVPREYRPRVRETLVEAERVIFAYVAGNVITSVFATLFVLVSLYFLDVPAALLLALIAGICDFIPVLGLILSSAPAIVVAFTVSGTTAVIVVALFVFYHAVENYVLAPWAYGDRLKLSNVAVVLAFVVGAQLAGVTGALIALPIAAVYPAIERIWLREALAEDTVSKHKAIEASAEKT